MIEVGGEGVEPIREEKVAKNRELHRKYNLSLRSGILEANWRDGWVSGFSSREMEH